MAAIIIRQAGPYTITCNDDGVIFCNGAQTELNGFAKPLANGAVATVDTLCKGSNGKRDLVSLQPAQVKTIMAARRARGEREQAEYNRTHAAELAALNARQRQADAYDRGMNEGGEGYNPYRSGIEKFGFEERQV